MLDDETLCVGVGMAIGVVPGQKKMHFKRCTFGWLFFPFFFYLFRTNISRLFEVRTEDLWVQVNHRNPLLIGCELSRSLIGCELSRSRSRGKGEFERTKKRRGNGEEAK